MVAPERPGAPGHAVVLGEAHSGRSTVIEEVARRAATERGWLVIKLRAGEELGRPEFVRHLLTAVVEGLAKAVGGNAEWYEAWRDRVYLRRTSGAEDRDILSSALVFAADSTAWLDRVILERDLAELARLASGVELKGVVVVIDDVSPLTEDVTLIEEIVEIFDAIGGYSLLLAGLPTVGRHFQQAASRCLERVQPVWLRPFGGPQRVYTALSTPLEGEAVRYTDRGDLDFLLDVLSLTGGNPYELMVVGAHLWQSCEQGEQEKYALTPRVLDRVIPHLALLATDGDALRDGAQAIDRLTDEQVALAVELAALSKLSIREVAMARLMKVGTGEFDAEGLMKGDIGEELDRVRGELEDLENAGVIQLHPDGDRFSVVGGRHASILLKYKARSRVGTDSFEPIFGFRFLQAVGSALGQDMARRIIEKTPEARSLGFSAVASDGGLGRTSPRQVVRSFESSDDIGRLIDAEIDVVPWNPQSFDQIGELLAADDPTIALLCTALSNERGQVEYLELWEVPGSAAHDEVARAVSEVAEEWQEVVARADLSWGGSQSAVLRGDSARRVLCALQSLAATKSVFDLFERWREDPAEQSSVQAAERIAEESVAVMRATGKSDLALAGELSGMLSRLGFLRSFDEERLPSAEEALEDALGSGEAEGWVTKWNLANVCARQGKTERALGLLGEIRGEVDETANANVLAFIPGRGPIDSLVGVTSNGIDSLIRLQQLIVAGGEPEQIAAAAADCRASEDAGAEQVAAWALQATGQLAN